MGIFQFSKGEPKASAESTPPNHLTTINSRL
jgi:hypothetical protein